MCFFFSLDITTPVFQAQNSDCSLPFIVMPLLMSGLYRFIGTSVSLVEFQEIVGIGADMVTHFGT